MPGSRQRKTSPANRPQPSTYGWPDRNPNRPVPANEPERAFLVGVHWPGDTIALSLEFLDELDMLAQTAGAEVVGREIAKRQKPDPATLIGKGKVAELSEMICETRADLIVFDEDLSPAQARNLEQGIGCRVIDRTGIILDIFAKRARTREAKTQVELAQLRYLLPRLTRAWTHLERQQGGIGLRGPGETQIETDRRIIRTRIRVLETELKHIEQIRRTQRAGRTEIFKFALVGYTNVGKSTLMNVLTEAGVYEEDLLFATLDSTTRGLAFGAHTNAVITDTVGFIRKLPPALVASFRSTLAEITEADCYLHVIDLASQSWRDQMYEVNKILAEMGQSDRKNILIFNKIDALDDDEPVRAAAREFPAAVFVSARKKTGIDDLLAVMRQVITADLLELTVPINPTDGRLLSELYHLTEVLDERQNGGQLELRVRLSHAVASRLGLISQPKHSHE